MICRPTFLNIHLQFIPNPKQKLIYSTQWELELPLVEHNKLRFRESFYN